MLSGITIAVTAERRAHQQVRYLESRGADVRSVPVLKTVEGSSRIDLHAATARITEQSIDLLIVHTGQVFDWWLDTVSSAMRPQLDGVLSNARLITRGSKATSTARRHGFDVEWQAPSETVRDIVAHLSTMDLTGVKCAVLLDGNQDDQVVEMARARGANVIELDVYRYAVPVDRLDIDTLIDQIIDHQIDIVTFTASPAIRHLRSIAAESGLLGGLDTAMSTYCRPAVVGPVCAATASAAGWRHMIEPATARLFPMLDSVVDAVHEPVALD